MLIKADDLHQNHLVFFIKMQIPEPLLNVEYLWEKPKGLQC